MKKIKTFLSKIKIAGFRSFFEEVPGRFSMMRLMSFLTLWFAFWVIGYQLYNSAAFFNKIISNTEIHSLDDAKIIGSIFSNTINIELVLILMVAAFIPKALQKFIEWKNPSNIKTSIDNIFKPTEQSNVQPPVISNTITPTPPITPNAPTDIPT